MNRFVHAVILFSLLLFSPLASAKNFTLADYANLRAKAQAAFYEYTSQNKITSLEGLGAEKYDSIVRGITKQLEPEFPFVTKLTKQEDALLNGFINREAELKIMENSPERDYQYKVLELEKQLFFSDQWEAYQNDKEKFLLTLKSE